MHNVILAPVLAEPADLALVSKKDRRADRLLRMKSVIARTGLSASTINRREATGSFPRRKRIGIRCVAWYESDIDDFVANPLRYQQD